MGRWGGGTPESEQGSGEERLFGYADMVNKLCVVYPIVHLRDIETGRDQGGRKVQETKDAIVCDVVCLSRGQQDVIVEEHRMVMIFAGRFIGLSKRHCGAGAPGSDIAPLLGTVTQDDRQGPMSRAWRPLHEDQNAVMLADRWADTVGANFEPSTPQQVDAMRAQRQQQQQRNDQMGWPSDSQPRGGQQGNQRQGSGQQWGNRPVSSPPQQNWGQQNNDWGQQRAPSGPPQGGWGQQQAQQNTPQPPAWAQQSATNQAPPQQNMPQGPGAQSTFDQMAAQQGFGDQGSGYAGAPAGSQDPWGSDQPPY